MLTVALVAGSLMATTNSAAAQSGRSTPCGNAPDGFNIIVSDAAVIDGTPGADFICAGDGPNIVRAKAGHDIVFGRGGNDSLNGGPGRDQLYGGFGDDRLAGNRGPDRLLGEQGRDRLLGGDSNDRLDGGAHRDRVFGGPGDDTIVVRPKADRIGATVGNDVRVQFGAAPSPEPAPADDETNEPQPEPVGEPQPDPEPEPEDESPDESEPTPLPVPEELRRQPNPDQAAVTFGGRDSETQPGQPGVPSNYQYTWYSGTITPVISEDTHFAFDVLVTTGASAGGHGFNNFFGGGPVWWSPTGTVEAELTPLEKIPAGDWAHTAGTNPAQRDGASVIWHISVRCNGERGGSILRIGSGEPPLAAWSDLTIDCATGTIGGGGAADPA